MPSASRNTTTPEASAVLGGMIALRHAKDEACMHCEHRCHAKPPRRLLRKSDSPQGRLQSRIQPNSVCQCVSASARPGMPSSLIGSFMSPSVCRFVVVYVYSIQLPAARRKARICQLYDTTHGSSSSPRAVARIVQSTPSMILLQGRGIHSSYRPLSSPR